MFYALQQIYFSYFSMYIFKIFTHFVTLNRIFVYLQGYIFELYNNLSKYFLYYRLSLILFYYKKIRE